MIVVLIVLGIQNIGSALYVLWSFATFGAAINSTYSSLPFSSSQTEQIEIRSRYLSPFSLASLAIANASNDIRSRNDQHPTRSPRHHSPHRIANDEKYLRYRARVEELSAAWSQDFAVRLVASFSLVRLGGWRERIEGFVFTRGICAEIYWLCYYFVRSVVLQSFLFTVRTRLESIAIFSKGYFLTSTTFFARVASFDSRSLRCGYAKWYQLLEWHRRSSEGERDREKNAMKVR